MFDENFVGIYDYYFSSLFFVCKWCNKEDCSIFGFLIVVIFCLIKLLYIKEKVNYYMSFNYVFFIKID